MFVLLPMYECFAAKHLIVIWAHYHLVQKKCIISWVNGLRVLQRPFKNSVLNGFRYFVYNKFCNVNKFDYLACLKLGSCTVYTCYVFKLAWMYFQLWLSIARRHLAFVFLSTIGEVCNWPTIWPQIWQNWLRLLVLITCQISKFHPESTKDYVCSHMWHCWIQCFLFLFVSRARAQPAQLDARVHHSRTHQNVLLHHFKLF
jgi:hypothetical protein